MPYASYSANESIYDACPMCDGKKTKGAITCRACKTDRSVSFSKCSVCETRIRAAYTMCRNCYDKQREAARPQCIDCGKPTKQYAYDYHAKRCWACEVVNRRRKPQRTCEKDGCQQPHMARGMCRMHYQIDQRKRKPRRGHTKIVAALRVFPCQICGYDKLTSRIHRLIPGGEYRVPNIVAICSRCHDEIHAGITLPPPPMTETEILSRTQSS